MMKPPKTITVDEFWRLGFLQEINRQVLHPAGLAMSVNIEENSGRSSCFGKIYDSRDDPEGFNYGPKEDLKPKAKSVKEMIDNKASARMSSLGYVVQPVE